MLDVLPVSSLRQTPRFAALTKLGGALLIGIAVGTWIPRLPRLAQVAALAALALLLPLEHWQPPLYGSRLPVGDEVPAVHRWLATEGRGPLVELPLFAKKRFWALYLYFSTYHWRPVPIGRTSFYPPSHELLAATLARFPDDLSIEVLDRLQVRTVVVHPELWDADERPHWVARVETAPRLELVRRFTEAAVLPWLAESRVYRIRPGEGPALAPCRLEAELPREGWRAASMTASGLGRLLDGRLDTAWTTRRPQAAGDRLRVTFDAPTEVTAVALPVRPRLRGVPAQPRPRAAGRGRRVGRAPARGAPARAVAHGGGALVTPRRRALRDALRPAPRRRLPRDARLGGDVHRPLDDRRASRVRRLPLTAADPPPRPR